MGNRISDQKPDSAAAARVVESQAIDKIARALAMSLADSSVRTQFRKDLRETGLGIERKLLPRKYLVESNGSKVALALAAKHALPTDTIRKVLSEARELELYMPVRQQRHSWTGEEPVLVAYQVAKGSPIVAYDEKGKRMELAENATPTIPIVAFVSRELTESDANKPPLGDPLKKASTAKGIGTLSSVIVCGDPDYPDYDCQSTGGGGTDPNDLDGDGVPNTAESGMYMVYSNILDLKEPWIRGDPEIEAHIVGPDITYSQSSLRAQTCASSHGSNGRYFDQNSHVWNGSVLLMTAAQMSQQTYVDSIPSPRYLNVLLYEDDDQNCVIEADPNELLNNLAWAGTAVGGLVLINKKSKRCQDTPGYWECQQNSAQANYEALGVYGLAYVILQAGWNIAETNDDYIGMAVDKAAAGYTDASANYAIIDAMSSRQINGGIRLVYHNYGH